MALLKWIPPAEDEHPVWWPLKPGHSDYSPQRTGLESPATLLLYGGGSGGGKSDWLVADAAQEVDNPNFRGVLLRKSFREMNNIIDRMKAIYRPLGARSTEKDTMWRFPSGAQIRLGYMSSDADVENYQGTPFSWLGVDEAGNHVESRIRRMLPWLASTDPTLRVRARFTANPGGVGSDWLMRLFLRDKCPIHYPEESVEGGALYAGKRLTWSDGIPLDETGKWTVSFIPALVGDNPLYGPDKIAALRTQEAAIAEKLLTGCWCALAGRYFSFLDPSFMAPYSEHPSDWWNTFLVSIDYGYGESWAAAGFYFITEPTLQFPEGRMIKIGEYIGYDEETGEKPLSEDFARSVIEAFISGGDGRRVVSAAICDPANDSHTGNGRSNMEIMGEVFAEYGIPMMPAHKSRIDNFQNLARMMKKRQVIITDACPSTFKSLNTRMHDPARPGDIKKIKGSKLDDQLDECLVEGTLIETESGPKPIESVSVGDMIYTREGLRRVYWAGMTGESKTTVIAEFSNRLILEATPNHPIFVDGKGFIRLDEIEYGDKIASWESTRRMLMKSCTGESPLEGIQTPHPGTIGLTILRDPMTGRQALRTSIGRFTKTHLGLSQTGTPSITKMKTLSIMSRVIMRWWCMANIRGCTLLPEWQTPKRSNFCDLTQNESGRFQEHGIQRKPAGSLIAKLQRATGAIRFLLRLHAPNAILPLGNIPLEPTSFAPTNACLSTGAIPVWMTSTVHARSAGKTSESIDTASKDSADVAVLSLHTGSQRRVFNLSIEGVPEYFANGILVHNCAYAANTYFTGDAKPTEIKNSERIQQFVDSGMDQHSVNIHRMKMMMAQDDDEAPVRISRVGQSRVISRG